MTKDKITFNSMIVQCPGNIVSDMDGEKVMMSINNGKYYNLGEIGGVIWDYIETPVSVNNLIDSLLSQYDVARNDCEKQVVSFLNHLYKENLVSLETEV